MDLAKHLEAYLTRYDEDADYRKLADSDMIKALKEIGVEDIAEFKAALEADCRQSAGQELGNEEMAGISGGLLGVTAIGVATAVMAKKKAEEVKTLNRAMQRMADGINMFTLYTSVQCGLAHLEGSSGTGEGQ